MMEEVSTLFDDFLLAEESYFDFAGRKRTFIIALEPHPNGYFLRATEQTSKTDDGGYQFAAYSLEFRPNGRNHHLHLNLNGLFLGVAASQSRILHYATLAITNLKQMLVC